MIIYFFIFLFSFVTGSSVQQINKERLPEDGGAASLAGEARASSPGPGTRGSSQSSSVSRLSLSAGVGHEVSRGGGARSPETDSPLPQPAKLENGESLVGRVLTVNVVHEEASPGSVSNGTNGQSTTVQNSRVPHAKLKRLLGTLVQFANDISPDTGDTVRSLVLSLLVSYYSSFLLPPRYIHSCFIN